MRNLGRLIQAYIEMTTNEALERVRQYCLYFLDDTPDLSVDCTDEEFDHYFIKKYPLLNHAGLSNGKTEFFDMADALFEIKHPQFNEISGLLYSSIFINDFYASNKIKLKEIYTVLKDNPLALVNIT
jgi:hypothetical protein